MIRPSSILAGAIALAALSGCKEEPASTAGTPASSAAPGSETHAVPVPGEGAPPGSNPNAIRRDLAQLRGQGPITIRPAPNRPPGLPPEFVGPIAAVPPEPPKQVPQAEVEVMGTVTSKGLKAHTVLVWIGREDCGKAPDNAQPFGRSSLPFQDSQNFFIEVFVPQDSTGYVCAAALDESLNAVADAAYEKNPIQMKGEGEVIFNKIALTLKPRATKAPLPKGLLP